jgi:hypothetical protein
LSAATDRLPISLQVRILNELTGINNFGECWSRLMTQRDFMLNDGSSVRYAVGQPMGFKTSFMMLALTHHLIVQAAALESGLVDFHDYVILGDDIVIRNSTVAKHYIKIMAELGMSISMNKSIVSTSETGSVRTAEICKRVFSDGLDFSPIPVKLVATVLENGDMAYQLQEELGRRNLLPSEKLFWVFCGGILSEHDLLFLAKLNGLPPQMTGMRYSQPFSATPNLNSDNFESLYGLKQFNLEEFHTYNVLVEQLKRADAILKNTTDIYSTITNAASVSKTVGIGKPESGYLPVENFTREELDEWEIIDPFHPAIEAVKAEVDRINILLMQLTNAESNAFGLLKSQVIDSLRISTYDTLPDRDFAAVKVTRKLIDQTIRSINVAKTKEHNLLSYSIKLTRLDIL